MVIDWDKDTEERSSATGDPNEPKGDRPPEFKSNSVNEGGGSGDDDGGSSGGRVETYRAISDPNRVSVDRVRELMAAGDQGALTEYLLSHSAPPGTLITVRRPGSTSQSTATVEATISETPMPEPSTSVEVDTAETTTDTSDKVTGLDALTPDERDDLEMGAYYAAKLEQSRERQRLLDTAVEVDTAETTETTTDTSDKVTGLDALTPDEFDNLELGAHYATTTDKPSSFLRMLDREAELIAELHAAGVWEVDAGGAEVIRDPSGQLWRLAGDGTYRLTTQKDEDDRLRSADVWDWTGATSAFVEGSLGGLWMRRGDGLYARATAQDYQDYADGLSAAVEADAVADLELVDGPESMATINERNTLEQVARQQQADDLLAQGIVDWQPAPQVDDAGRRVSVYDAARQQQADDLLAQGIVDWQPAPQVDDAGRRVSVYDAARQQQADDLLAQGIVDWQPAPQVDDAGRRVSVYDAARQQQAELDEAYRNSPEYITDLRNAGIERSRIISRLIENEKGYRDSPEFLTDLRNTGIVLGDVTAPTHSEQVELFNAQVDNLVYGTESPNEQLFQPTALSRLETATQRVRADYARERFGHQSGATPVAIPQGHTQAEINAMNTGIRRTNLRASDLTEEQRANLNWPVSSDDAIITPLNRGATALSANQLGLEEAHLVAFYGGLAYGAPSLIRSVGWGVRGIRSGVRNLQGTTLEELDYARRMNNLYGSEVVKLARPVAPSAPRPTSLVVRDPGLTRFDPLVGHLRPGIRPITIPDTGAYLLQRPPPPWRGYGGYGGGRTATTVRPQAPTGTGTGMSTSSLRSAPELAATTIAPLGVPATVTGLWTPSGMSFTEPAIPALPEVLVPAPATEPAIPALPEVLVPAPATEPTIPALPEVLAPETAIPALPGVQTPETTIPALPGVQTPETAIPSLPGVQTPETAIPSLPGVRPPATETPIPQTRVTLIPPYIAPREAPVPTPVVTPGSSVQTIPQPAPAPGPSPQPPPASAPPPPAPPPPAPPPPAAPSSPARGRRPLLPPPPDLLRLAVAPKTARHPRIVEHTEVVRVRTDLDTGTVISAPIAVSPAKVVAVDSSAPSAHERESGHAKLKPTGRGVRSRPSGSKKSKTKRTNNAPRYPSGRRLRDGR